MSGRMNEQSEYSNWENPRDRIQAYTQLAKQKMAIQINSFCSYKQLFHLKLYYSNHFLVVIIKEPWQVCETSYMKILLNNSNLNLFFVLLILS